jgi:hypothetical protein
MLIAIPIRRDPEGVLPTVRQLRECGFRIATSVGPASQKPVEPGIRPMPQAAHAAPHARNASPPQLEGNNPETRDDIG